MQQCSLVISSQKNLWLTSFELQEKVGWVVDNYSQEPKYTRRDSRLTLSTVRLCTGYRMSMWMRCVSTIGLFEFGNGVGICKFTTVI